MAQYCETPYALGVANGSDALFLILKALGIGPGDEVITCPNSFIATAWVIIATGAKPVFIDIAEDYNLDVTKLEAGITQKTRAVMPVHLTGRPADMNALKNIAQKYNLEVIEDAAQAIGARYYGNRVGSLGVAAGFSLHPLKNLGLYGDAGFITTKDAEIYHKINLLRNHGLKNRDECVLWGYNSRLDPLQAAILSIKISDLDKTKERINYIVNKYKSGLKNHVEIPSHEDYDDIFYHTFIIKTDKR